MCRSRRARDVRLGRMARLGSPRVPDPPIPRPDQASVRISSDSSSIRARRLASISSPVIEYSFPNSSLPRPTPSVSLPPLSRSSVAVSLATLTGRRRASGVTIGPSRTLSVDMAIAASVIHGSATSATGSRQRTWSHTKTPCQPASSASAERRATIAGSASGSKRGRNSPERMRVQTGWTPAIHRPGFGDAVDHSSTATS
jgi:hypothetical protein